MESNIPLPLLDVLRSAGQFDTSSIWFIRVGYVSRTVAHSKAITGDEHARVRDLISYKRAEFAKELHTAGAVKLIDKACPECGFVHLQFIHRCVL